MRPLRIAMLAPFGIKPKGTLLARMLPLAQALHHHGHHIHIYAPALHNAEDAGTTIDHGGVLVTHTRAPHSAALWWHTQRFQPDLIHLFKPKGHAGLAARWGRLVARHIPLVVDCDDREGVGGWNDELPYPGLAKALFAWQEVDLPRQAAAVTVASRTLQSLVWASGVDRQATFYVPNGANMQATSPPVPRTAATVVLYTRFWEFDLHRLVASIAALATTRADFHLHVIGSGENGEERVLTQLLAAHGLTSRVTLHGWLQPADIPSILARASVAMVPVADTLINRARCSAKLLELLAAGLVVVGHDVGEMRTFITHGHNGMLAPPDDPAQFADHIAELLKQPEQLVRMQHNAYQSAQQHAWASRVEACVAAYAHATRTTR